MLRLAYTRVYILGGGLLSKGSSLRHVTETANSAGRGFTAVVGVDAVRVTVAIASGRDFTTMLGIANARQYAAHLHDADHNGESETIIRTHGVS